MIQHKFPEMRNKNVACREQKMLSDEYPEIKFGEKEVEKKDKWRSAQYPLSVKWD